MILVTGGAGVMGARLVRRLIGMGKRVRVLALPNDPGEMRLAAIDCELVHGDVTDRDSIAHLFAEVTTVYHLAALIIAPNRDLLWRVNVEGTQNVVDCAAHAGATHFILVSSIAAANPSGSDYAMSKRTAEEIVREQGVMEYTIVRPTLTYGPDGGLEFTMMMSFLRKYPVVPFIGWGAARKNPVLADDIVSGLAAIADNPKTFGKTYDFSGGEEISMWNLAHLMLKQLGLSRPFVPIPVSICRLAAFTMERMMRSPLLTQYAISRIVEDAAPNHDAATNDLGYRPLGVTEGLRRCYPSPSP